MTAALACTQFSLGSGTDISACPRNVRFTPESGHPSARLECPLCAKSRHRYNAAADLLVQLHGCERLCRPRPETVQCELRLLSGLDINK